MEIFEKKMDSRESKERETVMAQPATQREESGSKMMQ